MSEEAERTETQRRASGVGVNGVNDGCGAEFDVGTPGHHIRRRCGSTFELSQFGAGHVAFDSDYRCDLCIERVLALLEAGLSDEWVRE